MPVDIEALQALQGEILELRDDPESLCYTGFSLNNISLRRDGTATLWCDRDAVFRSFKIIGMIDRQPTYRGSAEQYHDHVSIAEYIGSSTYSYCIDQKLGR